MRLELTLIPLEKHCTIPINYQYPLSGAIYRILSNASPEYAEWLHNHGYMTPSGKPIKMFVFSKLDLSKATVNGNTLTCEDSKPCKLRLSSPMIENFMENFVMGAFAKQEITIANHDTKGRFLIQDIVNLPEPKFQQNLDGSLPTIKFLCLSPIVVSNYGSKEDEKQIQHYIRPDEPEFPEAIRKNLIQKFITVYKTPPQNQEMSFSWEKTYIQRKGGYNKISKLITICEGDPCETKVKAFMAPFYLSGSAELIHIAYECGIGEKNSMGFGMIKEEQTKNQFE